MNLTVFPRLDYQPIRDLGVDPNLTLYMVMASSKCKHINKMVFDIHNGITRSIREGKRPVIPRITGNVTVYYPTWAPIEEKSMYFSCGALECSFLLPRDPNFFFNGAVPNPPSLQCIPEAKKEEDDYCII